MLSFLVNRIILFLNFFCKTMVPRQNSLQQFQEFVLSAIYFLTLRQPHLSAKLWSHLSLRKDAFRNYEIFSLIHR